MSDPGLSLKATTLTAAWTLLGHGASTHTVLADEAADAVEELALAEGLRSRRVLLDARWWRRAGGPMIARVAERRRVPRGPAASAPSPSQAAGTGWVALLPDLRGYRMLAQDEDGQVVEWRVDDDTASRLAPFGFSFHRRFAAKALDAMDMLRFAAGHGGRDLALLLVAGLAAALVGLFTPAATGWLIDRAIPAGAMTTVQAIIAGLAVAGAAIIALEVLRTLAVMRFEARTAVAMQAAIVDRVLSAPARFFRAFTTGDLASRIGAVNAIQRTVTGSTIGAFVTSIFLFANVGLMLAYSPRLTVAASALVVLIAAVTAAIGLARMKIGARVEALDGKLRAAEFEMLAGIAKLRAGAAEARAFDRWYAKYDAFRTVTTKGVRLTNAEALALNLLQPAATALVLAMAWKTAPISGMTTGDFVAFHAAMFSLLGGVYVLVSTALDLLNLKPVWDRARPILETLPEDGAHGLRHDPQGRITLDAVSFTYPGGPRVLHEVSLDIRPGEFVAIVGASGSGKSTLLRLLLGFETPESGIVGYDGHDVRRLDARHLRRRIGTVLQGGRLWAGDLLTNILGAANLGVEAATEAARRAGLERDIEAMPMGMYTVVGEGVSTLSGGQRQRVLIARALVTQPKILLLDEATSALDNVSQAHVLGSLRELAATRIVIAHRLNTVRDADRIVVLERGRVVQQGTFDALAGASGPFAAMLARQV